MVAFQSALSRALNKYSGGLFGWLMSESDVDHRMSGDRALTYAPVFQAVSMISGSFMIMPLNLHHKSGRNITIQSRHASYQLMRWRPNAYQTPAQFKRQMLTHILLWGNARAFIRREGNKPVELIPLMPDRTVSLLIGGMKYHMTILEPDDRLSVWENAELHPEKRVIFADTDVWHIPGVGFDGISGKSVISLARQGWGIGLAAEQHISKQQKKGYAGGLMLEAPAGTFREEGKAQEFLENFKRNHEGSENAGNIGLLREGITANVMTMSNTDAQFIEGRNFQVEEVERWFNCPGLLATKNRTSHNSQESAALAYRTNCLAPWTTAIEEESDLKLLTEAERKRDFYHKFNDGALLRTEKSVTMSFASQGIAARVLSPNEARELFDLNPYDGGDTYENPAVTPGSPGSDQDDSEPESPPEQSPEESAANQARIAHLIGVEAGKVEAAAVQATEKGLNFLQWVDDFYDHKWLAKLEGWLGEIAVDTQEAFVHCEESRRLLLEVCDYSTVENLSENVKKCVSTWKTRALLMGKIQNV